MVRWIVWHAEQYRNDPSHIKLAQLNALTTETYLKNKGRNSALEDWQFSQLVTALQIQCVELVVPAWAASFSWQQTTDVL